MSLRIGFFIFGLCIAFPAYADTAAGNQTPSTATTGSQTPLAAATENQTPPAAASGAQTSGTDAAPVSHAEDYVEPTWSDLLRTTIRFGAMDLHDNNLLDEYAAVNYCDIYKFYYKDDFKWNEIRKKIRKSTDMEMLKYPAHYYYYTVLQLDRYDFENKVYRFTDTTAIHDVNVFMLYQSTTPMCLDKAPHYIPRAFQAVSDTTFNLLGLPLAPADAQSLLRQMEADKNTLRTIVVKFDMTVTYIDRIRRAALIPEAGSKAVTYFQALDKPAPTGTLRMDVHLDSVSFYEDIHMTKLIYSVKP